MRRTYPLALLVLPLALAGCDRAAAPTQPNDRTRPWTAATYSPFATAASRLDALWPNEDGRRWDYDYLFFPNPELLTYTIYPTREEVPAAPLPADIVRLLPGDRPGPTPRSGSGTPVVPVNGIYSLHFDGQTTTLSGATGQNLVAELEERSAPARGRVRLQVGRDLLSRLALARPDLRAKLEPLIGSQPAATDLPAPLLLHGGAWEKTADHIGTYGDLDRELAWKFLDADLKPGSTFDFQLLPSLVPDVFLHALVVPRKDSTRLQGVSRELEVAYVVDYGLTEVVDAMGNTQGWARSIGYGSVTYAPGVGPVRLTEIPLAAGEDPTHNYGRVDLFLSGVTPGTVAVR